MFMETNNERVLDIVLEPTTIELNIWLVNYTRDRDNPDAWPTRINLMPKARINIARELTVTVTESTSNTYLPYPPQIQIKYSNWPENSWVPNLLANNNYGNLPLLTTTNMVILHITKHRIQPRVITGTGTITMGHNIFHDMHNT
jgi:hypothetical protein